MKKYILFTLLFIISPIIVSAEEMIVGEYGKYEDAIKIVKETMKSYYLRGPYLQYNYSKATYGIESPEESTSQDHKYVVCAAYTYDVYAEAFGMKYVEGKSHFPRYNYNIIEEAQDKYKDNLLDGSFVIYYQSTVNTTTENRQREKVKYIYGDNTNASETDDFENLVNQIRPGDIFGYSGHALIAYDVVINPKTQKKDVIILNSTASEYIRTRIDGTSKLSYNFLKSPFGYNTFLDVPMEGSVQWHWLSESSHYMKDGILNCQDEECAVIRPVYEKDGKAMFNYYITPSQYKKGALRTEYPGLFIEKTVNTGDNDSIYIDDELTYTIKITNKSSADYNKIEYPAFSIEETIGNDVTYIKSTQNATFQNGKVKWNINKLSADETITLTYTVKVKNDLNLVGNEIKAVGRFYKQNNSDASISTGTVENKIIPKVTKLEKTYEDCYNVNKSNNTGLALINEIYTCVTGNNYNFDKFSFEEIFIKKVTETPKTTSTLVLNDSLDKLDENHKIFKKMILNEYFSGTVKKDDKYYLPRITTKSERAKTIVGSDFKDGDILIYEINSSKFTKESGIYAYIYIGDKFIGINGEGDTQRNEFVYTYYKDNKPVSESLCRKYNYTTGEECNYAYNMYGGYPKIKDESIKESLLKFAHYQTLFDKDNYIILRPEQVIKEIAELGITELSKTTYIKNTEKLDLTGGKLVIKYNDGTSENLDLTNKSIKTTGFDNSKLGKNTITFEYEGYKTSYEVDIVKAKGEVNVETNPETGSKQAIIFILIIFSMYITNVYFKRLSHKSN